MSMFAKASFKASIYSASRPTYPKDLFRFVYDYHQRFNDRNQDFGWENAVDIGCGTGQATQELLDFRTVIGVDPSPKMVETAQAQFKSSGFGRPGQFQFRAGSAEDLKSVIPDRSVDLVIAAQASHWFDWKKVWPEIRRVLRPNGTAAFWIYSEFRLTKYPELTPLITEYAQGTDVKTSVGPHFQRPGRTILENHLQDVPSPSSVLRSNDLGDFQRVYFVGNHQPSLPASQTHDIIMRKAMNWVQLLGYLRSWSGLHTYHERYPEDLQAPVDMRFTGDKADLPNVAAYLSGSLDANRPSASSNNEGDAHGNAGSSVESGADSILDDLRIQSGDIAVRFWNDLREGVKTEGGGWRLGDKLDIEWPMALLLVRRMP